MEGGMFVSSFPSEVMRTFYISPLWVSGGILVATLQWQKSLVCLLQKYCVVLLGVGCLLGAFIVSA